MAASWANTRLSLPSFTTPQKRVYKPAVNNGGELFAKALMQGLNQGLTNYQRGQDRQAQVKRQSEQDAMRKREFEARMRQQEIQNARQKVLDERAATQWQFDKQKYERQADAYGADRAYILDRRKREEDTYNRGVDAENRQQQEHSIDRRIKMNQLFMQRAARVKTPAQWQALLGEFRKRGYNPPEIYNDFNEGRAYAITQAGDTLADLKREKLALGNEKLKKDLSGGGGPYKDMKERAGVSSSIRREWGGISKTFRDVRDSIQRVRASRDTGAGDVALIFNYMKMLDPGSAVREGEFATAEQTAGLPAQVVNIYNKLINGERLTPEMRSNFKTQAEDLFDRARSTYLSERGRYVGIAKHFRLDPKTAVPDFLDVGSVGSTGDPNGTSNWTVTKETP